MRYSTVNGENRKGQAQIGILITITLVIAIALLAFIPVINISRLSSNVQAATSYLENNGYVVFSSAEFDLIAKEATAAAAVIEAQAAVIAAQLATAKVDLFNSAEVFLFPATSDLTITLTAGNTNEWSAWTEIVDSGATTLPSRFSADAGYISDIHVFLASDASDGYNIEIAYGEAKTTLGRTTFFVPADGVIPYMLPIKSRRVPAGETVYYRMQSTGANGATVQARLRYFYE